MDIKKNLDRLKSSLLGRSAFKNKKPDLEEAFLSLLEEMTKLASNLEELAGKVNELEETQKKIRLTLRRGPPRYR